MRVIKKSIDWSREFECGALGVASRQVVFGSRPSNRQAKALVRKKFEGSLVLRGRQSACRRVSTTALTTAHRSLLKAIDLEREHAKMVLRTAGLNVGPCAPRMKTVAIPKTIYQTYKSTRLSIVTRWHINRMRRRNPEYDYQFYDDAGVEKLIGEEYGSDICNLYKRINIGAAKADFFRYAVLYKRGGVYLDIDSQMLTKLDGFIAADDRAIISLESNLSYYAQWALVYEPGHPFLAKTLEIVVSNLSSNLNPHDVHSMTGPGAYTSAIRECLKEQATTPPFRQVPADYHPAFKFRYPMSKFLVHGFSKKGHWQKQRLSMPVIT